MRRFIARGDIVVVKPNIGWDRTPIHAANTNPLVVAEIVRLVLDAGAKKVVVTDASCNEPGRCFTRSGIWKAAYDAGADVILPAAHRFRGMRLKGEVLDDWPVYTPLVEADKVINAPIAKHHNLAKYTAAMKNWYGSLGGRRNRLHQNIDVSIADLATFMRPTLTVVDGTRVLLRNGPQGGNVADAKEMRTVIATVDQVAADACGCELIGRTAARDPVHRDGPAARPRHDALARQTRRGDLMLAGRARARVEPLLQARSPAPAAVCPRAPSSASSSGRGASPQAGFLFLFCWLLFHTAFRGQFTSRRRASASRSRSRPSCSPTRSSPR